MKTHDVAYCRRAGADGWNVELIDAVTKEWVRAPVPPYAGNFRCRVVPKAGGWMPWYGGKCPLPDDTRVEVQFGAYTDADSLAGDWDWGRGDTVLPILAYRVLREDEDVDKKPGKFVKFLAWVGRDHVLRWVEEGYDEKKGQFRDKYRVPSEDIERWVEE